MQLFARLSLAFSSTPSLLKAFSFPVLWSMEQVSKLVNNEEIRYRCLLPADDPNFMSNSPGAILYGFGKGRDSIFDTHTPPKCDFSLSLSVGRERAWCVSEQEHGSAQSDAASQQVLWEGRNISLGTTAGKSLKLECRGT